MSLKGTCIVNAYCQFSKLECTKLMQTYLYLLISTHFFILTTNLHWSMCWHHSSNMLRISGDRYILPINPIKKRLIFSVPLCLMVVFLDEFVVVAVVSVVTVVFISVIRIVNTLIQWIEYHSYSVYCTRAIITRNLHSLNPLLKANFVNLRSFFFLKFCLYVCVLFKRS